MKFTEQVQSNGGKDFLKLKDGESVKGVFRGDPHEFRQHWGAGRGIVCTGDSCPSCREGERAAFRFRLNFIINENGAFTAKIFEQALGTYEDLRALHGAKYDLERTVVEITRRGSTKNDTRYSVIPMPDGKIDDHLNAEILKVQLHDLGYFGAPVASIPAPKSSANAFARGAPGEPRTTRGH